jgi:O-antigen/teichoic acid export membrane protein
MLPLCHFNELHSRAPMPDSKSSSIGPKLRELGSHSIIYGLGSIAQSAAGLLLLPILTSALSREDFGVYSMIVMASTIASAVFYLGITSALPRSYFDYTSNEDRRAVFTTAFIILVFGAMIQALIGFYLGERISTLLVRKPEYAAVVFWAFLGGSLGFVNQYFFSYLRILRKSISSVVFSLFTLVATVGLTLLLLNNSPGKLIVPFQSIVYTQITLMIVILIMYGKEAFILKLKQSEVLKMVIFGGASIIASFGSMIIDSSNRIIIERIMTLADVGAYSAVARIAGLLNVIMILPFTQIWSPMMMEYRFNSNIKNLFSKVFSLFLIIGGIVFIGSVLFSNEILSLLIRSGVNAEMRSSFILITLGTLICGTTNILVAGLFYERKVFQLSYVYYSIAALQVVLSFVIIPKFGIIGAAASIMVANIMIPIGVYALARKYFSFDIDWIRIVALVMICIPFLMYSLFLSEHYDFNYFIRIILFAGAIYLIYLKCFTQLDRVEMKKYLNNRMVTRFPR